MSKRMLAKLIQIYHKYISETSDSHRCWYKTAYVKRLVIRSSYIIKACSFFNPTAMSLHVVRSLLSLIAKTWHPKRRFSL